jgi:hypothetical protein
MLLLPPAVMAQNVVKGTVTDSNNEPIIARLL